MVYVGPILAILVGMRCNFSSPSFLLQSKSYLQKFIGSSILKPRYSEFCDIVNKTQLPFWGFIKDIIFDIVNYSI